MCAAQAAPERLQRLQILDEIRLLCSAEPEVEQPVVVIDDCLKIRRTSVVKIWRMLPKAAQRCRPILACGAPLRIAGIHADFGRIVQEWSRLGRSLEHVGEVR